MAWYHYHQLALVVAAAAMLVILVVTGTHWRQRVMHDALGEADRRRLAEQLAVDTNKTALPQTEQNYLKKKKGGLSVFRTRFRGYRSAAMKSVFERCKNASSQCGQKDIYQFGVYTGISMKQMLYAIDHQSVEPKSWARKAPPGARQFPRRLNGFDSFKGLPSEMKRDGKQPNYVLRRSFEQGAWDARKAMGVTTTTQLVDGVSSYLNDTRVKLVSGFFNESLTPQLAREMKPALYIDVDVDLYSSTISALSWMFENHLVEIGTVIGYDDWKLGGEEGEKKAHAEIAIKYGVQFRTLHSGHENLWGGAVFRVVSLGDKSISSTGIAEEPAPLKGLPRACRANAYSHSWCVKLREKLETGQLVVK